MTDLIPPDEVLRAFLGSYKLVVTYLEQQFAAAQAPSLIESALLTRLHRAPDQRLRMQEAGRYLVVTKSGISRIIDRMVKAGYVTREEWETDRRVTYIVLTDDGRQALRHSARVYREAFRSSFLATLDDDQLHQLVYLLDRVSAGMIQALARDDLMEE
jgi:DNA-binding MarR family transcriptional regulator